MYSPKVSCPCIFFSWYSNRKIVKVIAIEIAAGKRKTEKIPWFSAVIESSRRWRCA